MATIHLVIEDFTNEDDGQTGVRAHLELENGKTAIETQAEKLAMCLGELLPVVHTMLTREHSVALVEAGVIAPPQAPETQGE